MVRDKTQREEDAASAQSNVSAQTLDTALRRLRRSDQLGQTDKRDNRKSNRIGWKIKDKDLIRARAVNADAPGTSTT